jgi:mono/diheme cytochrome c family protein
MMKTLMHVYRWTGAAAILLTAAAAFPAVAATGEEQFVSTCSPCHQPTGMGIPGAFPALAGDPFVQGPKEPVISTVLNGRGGMPTFKGDLSDDQISAILSYVRSAWGNKAGPVTPADVLGIRNGTVTVPPRPITAH